MDISYIIVFGLYVVFLAWTSWKSSQQVESLSDFTTGGHRMGLLLGIGTSVATWVSVASVMGVPGFLYRTGIAAIIGWVAGWFLATAIMPILAYKVRRPEMPARTFPEFIRMRYEPFQKVSYLQLIVAVLMFVGYFIFSHLQVVGFGIVFSTITGIPYEWAIFGFLVFLIMTCTGGFWSVAATDTVNAILILVGLAGVGGMLPINFAKFTRFVLGWTAFVMPFVFVWQAVQIFRSDENRLPGVNTFTSRITSPMMSMPTRNMPSSRSFGRISSATRSWRSVILIGFAVPPAWILLRMSPSELTLRIAAYLPSTSRGTPFMRNRRISPFSASGTYAWAMT